MKNKTAHLVYPTQYQASITLEDKSSEYRTHTSDHAKRSHAVAETIMYPLRWNGQLLARIVQPSPGANKGSVLRNTAIRFFAAIGVITLIPFSIVSAMFGFPLRAIAHVFRPIANVMVSRVVAEKPELSKDQPLQIRTQNLGFVTSTMSILGDLRDVNQRAKELVTSITNDSKKPDVICFQESFHEDATRTLCEGLKNEYPYIIHNVAPCLSGFNSGAMVFSKYPILSADFERFERMLGPERFSPRGMLKVKIDTEQGELCIYNIHTQALIGQDRAQARLAQLKRVKAVMSADRKAANDKDKEVHQILVGDLNTSHVTAWGENNVLPVGQAEAPVLEFMKNNFVDPFFKDHDQFGRRKPGTQPHFLAHDNTALNALNLIEPSGTWCHGPFADKGIILERKMRKDREKNNQPAPGKIPDIKVEAPTWGTDKWQDDQTANTARFDYTLFPKMGTLDGLAEIRRNVSRGQSAVTDHLPVDIRIWVK